MRKRTDAQNQSSFAGDEHASMRVTRGRARARVFFSLVQSWSNLEHLLEVVESEFNLFHDTLTFVQKTK